MQVDKDEFCQKIIEYSEHLMSLLSFCKALFTAVQDQSHAANIRTIFEEGLQIKDCKPLEMTIRELDALDVLRVSREVEH
jgi:hypothetical protein